MRRSALGSKRASGHSIQLVRRARRVDPFTIHEGAPDRTLTGYGGLVDFARFTRSIGFDGDLTRAFQGLKRSPFVVYPMAFTLRTMVDLCVAGGGRPFDLEHLGADPVFQRLAGGFVPSVDVLYDDLRRFDGTSLAALDAMVGAQAIAVTRPLRLPEAHLDLDTSVLPVASERGGAAIGYNPQYPGRPSFHPILARIAESDVVLGGELRPGDTTFGETDVPFVVRMIDRAREAAPGAWLTVRIDSAGDCAAILRAIHGQQSFVLTKAKLTADLQAAILQVSARAWKTATRDADDEPLVQVAELDFRRASWGDRDALPVRVIAVRRKDRERRAPSMLWPEMEWTVDVYLSTDPTSEAWALVQDYDGRAGIEPLIGEGKGAWALTALSLDTFEANHALLLLKLLALNLLRRYAATVAPAQRRWRTPWLRRLLVEIPGRLVRSGRRTTLRLGRPRRPIARE